MSAAPGSAIATLIAEAKVLVQRAHYADGIASVLTADVEAVEAALKRIEPEWDASTDQGIASLQMPEWDEYTHGRDEPVAAPACPPDCGNTDMGRCPRCFKETGLGCPHGAPCDECLDDDPTFASQTWCRECGRLLAGPGRCDSCGRVGA